MSDFPRKIDDVTPAWLTETTAAHSHGAVSIRAIRPLEGVVNFQGTLLRAEVEADGLPTSLVIKLVPENEALRAIGRQLSIYGREAAFYAHIGADAGLDVPDCFGVSVDPETGDSALVLEDLTALRTGDQGIGYTRNEAERAVEAYARMHARWWNDPRLAGFDWLPPWNLPELVAYLPVAFQQAWPACRALFEDELDGDDRALGDLLAENLAALMNHVGSAPVTLVHGDARHDNLMFAGPTEPPRFVDWQYVASGRGTVDIAYYVSQGGATEVAAACERDLVARYHATLVACGVEDFSEADCWDDYRRLALYTLVFPIFTAAMIDPESMEQRTALGIILQRGFAAAKRLASRDLLVS